VVDKDDEVDNIVVNVNVDAIVFIYCWGKKMKF
jgi:hypothetical protein